jgi:ChrB-like protein
VPAPDHQPVAGQQSSPDEAPAAEVEPQRWLLLVYRIPSEPTRLRAGVWRKLKGLGAIYIQSSAAALPASPASERALRSLRAEIGEMGGSGYLFDAALLAGTEQMRQSFNAARDDEYEEIIDKCGDFQYQIRKEYDADHFTYAELEENEVDLVKLKGWLDRIRGRDVLGAAKQEATVEAVAACEKALEEYAGRVYAEEGEEPRPA